MGLRHLEKTILACVAVFLILCAAGCPFDADDVKIYTPDSATAWTPVKLTAWISGFGTSYDGSWTIKNAGTTHAKIKDRILYTMAPGTVSLTATFKFSSQKDVIKNFTIRIDPAPEEIHALGTELVAHDVNTTDNPISLKANIDLAHWDNLRMMLIVADRYVNIDLTDSTGTEIPNSTNNFDYKHYKHYYSIYPKLLSVVLPDSITSIGNSAFNGCTILTSVTIGNNVTSIGNYAFDGCNSLTGFSIPNNVTSIGEYAFRDCDKFISITIPNGVTIIKNSVFSDCSSLTSISIPSSVTDISNDAFAYTSLTSVTIPNSVSSIGESAFYGCSSLTNIIIPNSVTSIGNKVFSGCTKLTSVTIPDSIASIGDWAFNSCKNLTSITIPNGVTSIGEKVFSGCTSLASITIPSNITSIGREAFDRTPWSDNLPDGLVYVGKVAYIYKGAMPTNTSITLLDGTKGIAPFAFNNYTRLTSITIPNSVTNIGAYAFSVTGLTSVTIPNSVTSIGDWAFKNCLSLTSVTFEGIIAKTSFGDAFNGDLRFKYLATNGGPGTYTIQNGTRWSKK